MFSPTPTLGIEPRRPEGPRVPVSCNTTMRYGHVMRELNWFKKLSVCVIVFILFA